MLQKEDKLLYHKKLLTIIKEFDTGKSGTLDKKKSAFAGLKAKMKRDVKEMSLSFKYDVFSKKDKVEIGINYKRVSFSSGDLVLKFDTLFLTDHHSGGMFKGSVSRFYTEGFSLKRKYYYRLIIPLKEKFDYHFQVENIIIKSDIGYSTRSATKATISNTELITYILPSENRKNFYLGIECASLQDFEEFSEKAFALKNAIGFVAGYLVGDCGYFFAYSRSDMKDASHFHFSSFRSTIRSSYTPINSNPYSWLSKKGKVAEKYYKGGLLRTLQIKELSTLSQKLHDDGNFASAIILIMESSIASLLFMPGGFAIALETLSDIIIGEDKLKITPIKDKGIGKKLRAGCIEIIKGFRSNIDAEGLKVLIGRIEHINQPTNKARLKAPFEKLKISLTDQDLQILESRNDFLHGRMPDITGSGKDRNDDRKNRDLYYASMRFYTLLSLLILKWIGYDNYVLNYPKIQEGFCQIKVREQPYRKV